jgi:hypothetical protein
MMKRILEKRAVLIDGSFGHELNNLNYFDFSVNFLLFQCFEFLEIISTLE